ncbi:MAG: pentapeptide repeat-containing protein [Spirochaetaceae bacterium]|jgi:uncharacterized protein YjbI with pentapeptide repeats|nr:pentapeptide repeat-containing protein [Spirochaetaceae bacterium]
MPFSFVLKNKISLVAAVLFHYDLNMIKGSLRDITETQHSLDRDFSSIVVENTRWENKIIEHCRFSKGSFTEVEFKNCQFKQCFMDFSSFKNCRFEDCRMTLSILACSQLENCHFIGCDLISVNFNGITFISGSFEESDLYYSRYVKATIQDSRFYDCNLKRVDFHHSIRENCSFKSCNIQDAYIGSENS